MRCPICGSTNDKVLETRNIGNGSSTRRRRECLDCGFRFTSYEHVEDKKIMVVKSNNTRQEFSKEKMANGIYKSLEKRPIANKEIDYMIQMIEEEIMLISGQNNFEIRSKVIGDIILKNLRDLDQVAYIRFASVYRKFEDLSEFIKEIENITEHKIK